MKKCWIVLLCLLGCSQNDAFNQIKYKEEKLISVSIHGMVKQPGTYLLEKESNLNDLIKQAGGYEKDANVLEDKVLKDRDAFFINSNKIKEKINLNQASLEDLTSIPGIGPSLANKILAYRKNNNAFQSLIELLNIKGIKEKKFNQLFHYFTL